MMGRLRRKFIATNMILVSIVLFAVFAVQTFSTYQRAREQVNRANVQALEWIKRAELPSFEFVPRRDSQPPEEDRLHERPDGERSGKAFSFTPVFAVEIDINGQIVTLQAGPGSTITRENAQALVDQAMAQPDRQGDLPGQNITYLYLQEMPRRFFAFADNSSVGQAVGNQLLVSLLISAAALLAFYLISRFLARLSLRPVETAWEQQRQFVADASHELKTPLAVILANADIMAAHPSETVESQGKWLGYIREEAQRMRSLVEDLLFLAKSDAQKLPLNLQQVRLSELVTASLLSFEPVAFEAGVTLSENIAPGVSLSGDEGQLRRLAVILLDNAVKYAGEHGEVTVTLSEAQGKAQLTVHNTGPAIPPEQLPHLFERFYRADAARDRESGGYGLGLAIAQSIAQSHGGKISVASDPKSGTTFTVQFGKR